MRIAIPERLPSGEVLLRPLQADDAPAYAQAFLDDPQLGRRLGTEHHPTADHMAQKLADIAEGAEAGKWLELAVAQADTGAFLGAVILHSLVETHRRCEIGFWVVPSARGASVARAAVSCFLDWIFDALPIDRVEMTTTPDNEATRRLANRLGFVEEGVLRKRNVERDSRVDLVTSGLLVDDWRITRPRTG